MKSKLKQQLILQKIRNNRKITNTHNNTQSNRKQGTQKNYLYKIVQSPISEDCIPKPL